MKRVLILTGIQVFPPQSGGQMRTAALAGSLARAGYDVFIYSFTGRKPEYLKGERSSSSAVAPRLSEYVDRSKLRGLLQFLTYRLGLPNLWFSIPSSLLNSTKILRERLEWAEIVVMDFPFHHPVLDSIPDKPKILNSHNLEHKIPYGSGPIRFLISKLVKKVEVQAAKKVDVVLSCGEDDKGFYRAQAKSGCVVLDVPNALDLERLLAPDENGLTRADIRSAMGIEKDETVFLFTASKYGPNKEAFEYLRNFEAEMRDFLESRKIRFLVVGTVCDEAVRVGQMICTSFVEETKPYFLAADFALNPILLGAGTNVKMFEYMAHRLPVISTVFGTRGFQLFPGGDYLSFDRDELGEALEKAVNMTAEERVVMAESAHEKNRRLFDMDAVVESVVKPALETLESGSSPETGALSFSPMPI